MSDRAGTTTMAESSVDRHGHEEPSKNICGMKIKLKYIALVLLVAQTVGAIVMLRVSRTGEIGESKRYISTTAVVASEVLKLVGSIGLMLYETNWNVASVTSQLNTHIANNFGETLKVGVPAFLYTLQNNLIFIALSNISPAMYQVTYQLKILSTALLSVVILHRSFSGAKWLALFILTAGVALIQYPGSSSTAEVATSGSTTVGVAAVLCACVTSGFAGVYFEKILKSSKTSIWLRNVQLAIFGIGLGICGAFWNDGERIMEDGFFQGYNSIVWTVVLLQSAGGLIVAAVVKYADNVLKCFGNALAIVLSCLASYYLLQDFQPSFLFAVGTFLVILATTLYSLPDINLLSWKKQRKTEDRVELVKHLNQV